MVEIRSRVFKNLDKEQEQAVLKKRETMNYYVEYEINPWDTLSILADKNNITLEELLLFNDFLWKDFQRNNNWNIILKLKEVIYIPHKTKIEQFRKDINEIKKWWAYLKASLNLYTKDIKELWQEIVNFFPNRPQPYSIKEMLTAILNAQSIDTDPNHPPFLDWYFRDVKYKWVPLCLSVLRYAIRSALWIIDISDRKGYPFLTDGEWEFLTKENMDAWMLWEFAKDIWFKQEYDFMEFFDRSNLSSYNPIFESKKLTYWKKIEDMYNYIKKNSDKVVWSFVPFYFVNSHAKDKMWQYNKQFSLSKQHLNTHQTLFAGNWIMSFEAKDFWEWWNITFSDLKEMKNLLNFEVSWFKKKLESLDKILDNSKVSIDSYIGLNKSSTLLNKYLEIDNILELSFWNKKNFVKKVLNEEISREEDIDKLIKNLHNRLKNNNILSWDLESLKKPLFNIINLQKRQNLLSQNILKFREDWLIAKKNNIEINVRWYWQLSWVNDFVDKINHYNSLLKEKQKLKNDIYEKEWLINSVSQEYEIKEKENTNKKAEIEHISSKIAEKNYKLGVNKKKLIDLISGFWNNLKYKEYISRLDNYIYRKIDKYLKRNSQTDNSIFEVKTKEFNDLVSNKNSKKIYELLYSLWYKAWNEEISNLISIWERIRLAKEDLIKIQKYIIELPEWEFINLQWFNEIFAKSEEFAFHVKDYNNKILEFNSLKDVLKEKQAIVYNTKTYNIIDYIINFVQYRADFSWSQSPKFREDCLVWLKKWPNMIDIKVNWVKINIKDEIEKQDKFTIKSTDKVEIFWPLMIDAEVQSLHKDIKRHNISVRSRFLFEFLICERYLPTELLVPKEWSIFKKEKFDTDREWFKIKYLYYLEKDQSLEPILKKEIIKHEKLNPLDENFESELNRHYALQIKALQMHWYLKSEAYINPWAFKTYSWIPYFDASNVKELYTKFLNNRTNEKLQDAKENVVMKTFLEITTIEWDNWGRIYNRFLDHISLYTNSGRYPSFEKLRNFNEYQKRTFLKKVLQESRKDLKIVSAEKFLENIKPWFTFVIKNSHLSDIIDQVSEISYIKTSPIPIFDSYIVDYLLPTAQMNNLIRMSWNIEISNNKKFSIWDINSITDIKDILKRKTAKQFLERRWFSNWPSSVWDFQLRFSDDLLKSDQKFQKSDINNWLNKDSLYEAFKGIDKIIKEISDPENEDKYWVRDQDMETRVNADLNIVNEIKEILKRWDVKDLTFEDRELLNTKLRLLIQIDDGSWDNVVGKILSIILFSRKLNTHFVNLSWWFREIWYDLDNVFWNEEYMKRYEKYLLFINNQWEANALISTAENYIIRIFQKWMWINLHTKSVLYEDDPNATLKEEYWNWLAKDQTKYNKWIFIENITNYIKQVKNSKKNLTIEETEILEILSDFRIQYAETNEKVSPIYKLLKNPKITNYLKNKKLDIFILASDDEIYNTVFQRTMFNVHKKIDVVSNKWVKPTLATNQDTSKS